MANLGFIQFPPCPEPLVPSCLRGSLPRVRAGLRQICQFGGDAFDDAFPVILFFLFGVAWGAWTRHAEVSWKGACDRYKPTLEAFEAERSELVGQLNGTSSAP